MINKTNEGNKISLNNINKDFVKNKLQDYEDSKALLNNFITNNKKLVLEVLKVLKENRFSTFKDICNKINPKEKEYPRKEEVLTDAEIIAILTILEQNGMTRERIEITRKGIKAFSDFKLNP